MEELEVTRYWMAGVMAIMVIFGAVAVAGVFLRNQREASIQEPQDEGK